MPSPRPIGFWLKLVDRLIDEQFASTLDEHGVTRRQWQLLNVLTTEPATVDALDAAVAPFVVDGESSGEHLAELVESGWVSVSVGTYALEERGRAALDRLSQVVSAQRTLVTEGLTQAQYDETLRVLETMARNLGWSEQA